MILHVLGPGVQLALTVSNNDSVAFLKSLAAANLWQRMSHPGLASPDDLAKKMRIGRLDYFWDDDNDLSMYGVGEGAYEHLMWGQQRKGQRVMEIHEYLIRHFALIASLRADPHAFFVHTFYHAEELGLSEDDVCAHISSMLRAYEMYIANRFGHWFRLPWAWALLCHSVYGRDVAKQLVELVNSGRLARSGVLAAKIDYAGVLADDALWAAVVAFAAGTDPLDAAAHTQSLKKLRRERFPARRAPQSAVAGARPRLDAHTTQHAPRERAVDAPPPVRAPPRRRVGLRDPRRRVGVGPLQPTPRTP